MSSGDFVSQHRIIVCISLLWYNGREGQKEIIAKCHMRAGLRRFRLVMLIGVVLLTITAITRISSQTVTSDDYAVHLPLVLASSPPQATISYYVTGVKNTEAFYNLGCEAGGKVSSGVIILAFGRPHQEGNVFGTILVEGGEFASIDQIIFATKRFIVGYWTCSPTDAKVRIAPGTNNCGIGNSGTITRQLGDCIPGGGNVSYAHGKAWAQMINDIDAWVKSPPNFGDRIFLFGAIDIEPVWNYAADTRDWVDGYNEINKCPYYNFGSCDGCPYFGNPTGLPGSENNPWTLEDIYYVSYGASPALVIPQIYTENGAQADQWYTIKAYARSKDKQMVISGSLTQYQACQTNGPCPGANNTPEDGWRQLFRALNSSSFHTDHNHGPFPLYDEGVAQPLDFATDISW